MCHKSKRLIGGFTLIEMMVVIGIIAILGAVVIPGFRSLYRMYKTYEVYHQADTLFRTLLAYYIVMNEDSGSTPHIMNGMENCILKRFTPFLPSNSFDPQKEVSVSGTQRQLAWKSPDKTAGWRFIGCRAFCIVKKRISGGYSTIYWWDDFVKRYSKLGWTFKEAQDGTIEVS